jgi:glycosyltransferase involved in cell wall biosynthesis
VPFILFVSTIERRKNHDVLLKAYARLVEDGHKAILPRLVFVGMRGWGVVDTLNDIELDPRVSDIIDVLSDVDDDELGVLYDSCLFTVFPSVYEGWGLGVVESLARGKFCISSNAGSLPEAGGELVAYVDPLDTLGWAKTLLYYITNPEEVRRREQIIQAEYRHVSWEKAAQDIFAAVEGVASGTRAVACAN